MRTYGDECAPSPEELMIEAEDKALLVNAVNSLDPSERYLVARRLEGASDLDLVVELGTSLVLLRAAEDLIHERLREAVAEKVEH